jgi:L-ascorbate metabolism protein UlaG (beta-lactamase superfamily)
MKTGHLLEPAWCGGVDLQREILGADGGADQFRLWWLGQSGFLLRWDGHFLLFDPYLSDSLTEKYGATDKPHVRLSERVIDPSLLGMVRLVTSSHLHTDHLDAATLWPLAAAAGGLQLVLPGANEAAARERLGDGAAIEYVTVEEGGTREVGVFRFTAVAAAHNEIERDEQGRCRFLSFVVRFGPFCVWHSGDTLWHDGLVAALRAARPDLVMVPINGNDPARRVAGNLNGTEAAALARACGARLAVPHHFGMFAFNTADPREFVEACGRLQQPCRVLRGGESLTLGQASSDVVGGAVD